MCGWKCLVEARLFQRGLHFPFSSQVKSLSRVQLFATSWTAAYQTPPSWDFPGKRTGVGCHFLLQGIFPTQGLNPGLPHCRQTLYCLSHQGRSEILQLFIVLPYSLLPTLGLLSLPALIGECFDLFNSSLTSNNSLLAFFGSCLQSSASSQPASGPSGAQDGLPDIIASHS